MKRFKDCETINEYYRKMKSVNNNGTDGVIKSPSTDRVIDGVFNFI